MFPLFLSSITYQNERINNTWTIWQIEKWYDEKPEKPSCLYLYIHQVMLLFSFKETKNKQRRTSIYVLLVVLPDGSWRVFYGFPSDSRINTYTFKAILSFSPKFLTVDDYLFKKCVFVLLFIFIARNVFFSSLVWICMHENISGLVCVS